MKKREESGFALLLVLVMAAAIAISLYMEVPRVAFESQRAREQMTIDRADQYVRAIQLFYRKYHTYPQTLDDLETTRNIRFLRHRYKDPLTGKDFRLLHVGPTGQLTDSLVTPLAAPGSNGGSNQSGNTTMAQTATPNDPNDPNGQPPDPLNMAARRPSDRIPGGGQAGGAAFPVENPGEQPPTDPNQPVQPGQPINPTVQGFPVQPGQPGQPIQPVDPNQPNQPPPEPGQLPGPLPQMPGQTVAGATPFPGQAPFGQNPAQQGQQAGMPGATPPGAPGAPPSSAAAMIQRLLTTPRQPPSNLGGFTSGNTGGIAGVASTAEGKGIHVVNDHSKYKQWEFVYDLKKDKTVVGAAGVNAQQQMQQQLQQGQQPGANSPFGSNPFGSGSTPTNTAAPAAPTTPPPSQ